MQSKCAPLNVRKGYFRDVFAQDEPNVSPIARGVDGLGSLERGDASVAAFEDRRSQIIYVQVGSRLFNNYFHARDVVLDELIVKPAETSSSSTAASAASEASTAAADDRRGEHERQASTRTRRVRRGNDHSVGESR